jgi:hypothetical protein
MARRYNERHGGISTGELCQRTGASLRQIDYWYRQGWICPSVRVGAGTGHGHRWSEDDIFAVRLVAAIPKKVNDGDLGMEGGILRAVELVGSDPNAYWLIVTDTGARTLSEFTDLGEWAADHPAGRFLLINLAALREEVDPTEQLIAQ